MSSRLRAALLVAATPLIPAMLNAQVSGYTFTPIATSGGRFLSFSDPSINRAGTAAFAAELFNSQGGVFKGQGGPVIAIATAADGFSSFGDAAINDWGTVAFRASTDTVDTVEKGRGGDTTTVASTANGSFLFFGDVDINNTEAVAWLGVGLEVRGIFSRRAGQVTTVVDDSGPFDSFGPPDLNDGGDVVFLANLDSFTQGIFVADRTGRKHTVARDIGRFSFFGDTPTINNEGTVAFTAGLSAGGEGIFTAATGVVTTVTTSSNTVFRFFDDPALNEAGSVAFSATLDDGTRGIFKGADPVLDRVIATGDALAGSTVTYLFATSKSLNDLGQIVFYAELANGQQGVFRADPQ